MPNKKFIFEFCKPNKVNSNRNVYPLHVFQGNIDYYTMKNLPLIEHPEIPSGDCCYTILDVIKNENGMPRLKTKNCPHWKSTENGAYCAILNEEHYEGCPWHLVWDQLKECRINIEDSFIDTEDPNERSVRLLKEGYKLENIICDCGKEMKVWHKGKGTWDNGRVVSET